jgi:hypothetical protein
MKHLNGTRELELKLSAENLHCIKWYVDAPFAVHPDYKSHTRWQWRGTINFKKAKAEHQEQHRIQVSGD